MPRFVNFSMFPFRQSVHSFNSFNSCPFFRFLVSFGALSPYSAAPGPAYARMTKEVERNERNEPSALVACPGAIALAAEHSVYQEMLDFLGSGPSARRIVDFKVSPSAQERLDSLLEKSREEGLTEAEETELDVYELVHHSMIRLKASARIALAGAI